MGFCAPKRCGKSAVAVLFAWVLAGFYRLHKGLQGALDGGLSVHEVFHEARRVFGQAKQVVHHQYLGVSASASANANDWNIELFADVCRQVGGNTLQHQQAGAGVLDLQELYL